MVEENPQNHDHNEQLVRKLADMERELAALRMRNQELELERAHHLTSSFNHSHNHHNPASYVETTNPNLNLNAPAMHSEPGTTVVSPLVLSPSSIPPNEETMLQKQIQSLTKTEDDLIAQLHKKDEKIDYLEQNITLYKKKLRQTEELLYELQWDPSQDLEVFQLEDKKEVQSRHEKKIAQLLEQMRIMEKGLREKQQLIDELRGVPYEDDVDESDADQGQLMENHLKGSSISLKNSTTSPSLKSVVVASDGVARLSLSSSGGLRNSQSLRRRGSTSQQAHHSQGPAPSPSSASWLSFIPFFGNQTPPAKTATL